MPNGSLHHIYAPPGMPLERLVLGYILTVAVHFVQANNRARKQGEIENLILPIRKPNFFY
jgi:hypothetical protein